MDNMLLFFRRLLSDPFLFFPLYISEPKLKNVVHIVILTTACACLFLLLRVRKTVVSDLSFFFFFPFLVRISGLTLDSLALLGFFIIAATLFHCGALSLLWRAAFFFLLLLPVSVPFYIYRHKSISKSCSFFFFFSPFPNRSLSREIDTSHEGTKYDCGSRDSQPFLFFFFPCTHNHRPQFRKKPS